MRHNHAPQHSRAGAFEAQKSLFYVGFFACFAPKCAPYYELPHGGTTNEREKSIRSPKNFLSDPGKKFPIWV